jgi:osmotically inducible protein OsmC
MTEGCRLPQPGASGTGTNPEQLLAAGWSACFLSAIKLIAGKKKIALPAEVAIDAEVYLGLTQGAYGLGAGLNASLPGMDQAAAQSLVEDASHICPYSVALSGSIEVKYNVTTSEPAERRETVHA